MSIIPSQQQHDAIHITQQNLIVTAGAGSGKTRVLVERYIKLLLEHPDWALNNVVAITFTREAAMEMLNRVRSDLTQRLTQATAEEKPRLSALLSQMDSARISTIHGICSTILRANAAEANIDPQFSVMEEVESALLREQVVQDIEQELSIDDPNHLLDLLNTYSLREVREALSNATLLATPLPPLPDLPNTLVQQWYDLWKSNLVQQSHALKTHAQLLEAYHSLPEQLPNDNLSVYVQEAKDYLPYLWDEDVDKVFFGMDRLSSIKLSAGSQANWGGKEAFTVLKANLKIIREVAIKLQKEGGERFDSEYELQTAQLLFLWHQWLSQVQEAYRIAKQRRGVLDFNDLESRTVDLFAQHPSVRQRYQQTEIKHLLVDEFQDTNDSQWRIVQALAPVENQGTLFVVGDTKQSIYGFRGADVSVFEEVRATVKQQGRNLYLTQSYRSQPSLIAIFNELFTRLMVRDETSPVREYQIQLEEADLMQANRAPIVASYASIEARLFVPPTNGDKTSTDEIRQMEADSLARWIKQLKEEQASIHDKEAKQVRAVQYGDFAILLRALTDVSVFEDALDAYDIPFVTVAGRGYYNRQEVWDMLNLLKAVYNPMDHLALASVLRSPMFGFSDDLLLLLRANPAMSLWDALSNPDATPISTHPKVIFAVKVLRQLASVAGRVTITELLMLALESTAYLATLSGLRGGTRLRRNVEKLVRIAQQSNLVTLGDFTEYVAQVSAKDIREGEAPQDASMGVRIMTIHASKGLEFPIVCLPDLSRADVRASSDNLLYERTLGLVCKFKIENDDKRKPFAFQYAETLQKKREEAENLRLLYVAMTRARDAIWLSGKMSESNTTSGMLKTLIEPLGLLVHESPFEYAEGAWVNVESVPFDPQVLKRVRPRTTKTTWDNPPKSASKTVPAPGLMKPVQSTVDGRLLHISATQLANLGGFKHTIPPPQDHYRRSFRQGTLNDAPSKVAEAMFPQRGHVPMRVIGQIVHEALRNWQMPSKINPRSMEDILESYAWRFHVTNPKEIDEAVNRALSLLQTFEHSQVCGWIQEARDHDYPLYPELPFLFRTDKRILHGMIDMVFQMKDGQWVVLDYKTSYLGKNYKQTAADYTRRYYLQIGAYAESIRERFGGMPKAYIHYVLHNHVEEVQPSMWQAELLALEETIGRIVQEM
jgi:ATP-dependent helicase/nuclease subunit A